MIVKLQRPLLPADADVLVCNQSRDYSTILPQTAALKTLFGDKHKIYCDAEIKKKKLRINRIVPDESW